MKKLQLLLVAGLLVLAYGVGRLQEYENHVKDYQSACVLSDICHYMMDNIGNDAEEIYYDYVDNLDCDPNLQITKEDVKEYYWMY